jgi:superfamily II DNA or RNA helicase
LCFERQRIIQNAANKYRVLEEILDTLSDVRHCLIYSSPQQISRVQEILNQRHIIQHKFTQEEGTISEERYGGKSERDYILENFANGFYQVLVAIRCLDEGVDIPQARTAIILASTGNPREYIQRRGRVLRRFPRKQKAVIHDVIVFPNLSGDVEFPEELLELERKMVSRELRRYEEFANASLNVIECIKRIHETQKELGWR